MNNVEKIQKCWQFFDKFLNTKMCGVYCLYCLTSDKFYIGSSCNIVGRFRFHRSLLRRGIHHSIKLQRSFDKHGYQNFIFGLIEEVNIESLRDRENYWIGKFDSFNNGYNSNPHAEDCTGRPLDMNHKSKISMANLKKLTYDQILIIKEQMGSGVSNKDIAKKFGISRGYVSSLRSGRNGAFYGKIFKKVDQSGSKNPSAKLSEDVVYNIKCDIYDNLIGNSKLAIKYGISLPTIEAIKYGRI